MTANDNAAPAMRRSGSERRQRARGAVLVRLLPEERAAVEQNASAAGLSLASYARACMLLTPGPRAKRRAPVDAVALAQAAAALNKVGSNLNQIAHVLNAGGAIGIARECLATLAAVREAVTRMLELAGRKGRS